MQIKTFVTGLGDDCDGIGRAMKRLDEDTEKFFGPSPERLVIVSVQDTIHKTPGGHQGVARVVVYYWK